MKLHYAGALAVAAGLIVSGCATKQYGRMQPLSAAELSMYNCRDIALELSKVDAFDQQVRDQGGFDGRSALGVLGDFGIGNSIAKGGAEKSSYERRRELQSLSAQRGCTPYGAAPAPAHQPSAPARPEPTTPKPVATSSALDPNARVRCDTCR